MVDTSRWSALDWAPRGDICIIDQDQQGRKQVLAKTFVLVITLKYGEPKELDTPVVHDLKR